MAKILTRKRDVAHIQIALIRKDATKRRNASRKSSRTAKEITFCYATCKGGL